ncbi:ionotropic receptor 75a-like [Anopheles ziemanni]|uniref:ionotropic receptor 75a-like n=1 Tax=Anopheles coustani TaxID=139045 RepID=UPI00265B32D7|nr:ionotropic receptor 75a-like [Anopheles coustani]XP_058178583.1 ionotropic receptor 75a-like [Anopheles ziemanni]
MAGQNVLPCVAAALWLCVRLACVDGQWIDGVGELAVDYYRARDVKSVTALGCWNHTERHKFFRTFTRDGGMLVQFVPDLAVVYPNQYSKGGMLIDATCESVLNEMRQMGRELNKLLVGNVYWLFVENPPNDTHRMADEDLLEYLVELYNDRFRLLDTMPYTNVVIRVRSPVTDGWTLVEVFKPNRNARLVPEVIVTEYGTMCGGESLLRKSLAKLSARSAARRRNLQGYSMPCGMAITSPEYFKSLDDRNDVHDLYTKANFPFIRELMYDLNFTLNMVQVDAGGYKRNGTFSGLMGKFQNRSIELGCMGCLMRTERLEVVDFMVVTLIIRSSIIFRQPPLSIVSNIFELPFSVGVWLSCVALMVVYWIAMVALRCFYGAERYTVIESLIYLIGVMSQRGNELVPHFNGTRLLMFSFQLTSFFIITSYSASIVALLQSPSRAIMTVGDLVRSPLQAGVMDTSYGRVYYTETPDPDVQELYRRKIRPHGERSFIEPPEGIGRVQHELYAFEAEVNAAYKVIKETFAPEEVCKLHELEALKLPPFGIPIVKGSKYRELMRQRLMWQREVGIIKRFNIIWIHQKPQCENPTAGYTSVRLVEMRYLYCFLAVGFLAALLALAVERTWFKERSVWARRGRKIIKAKQARARD